MSWFRESRRHGLAAKGIKTRHRHGERSAKFPSKRYGTGSEAHDYSKMDPLVRPVIKELRNKQMGYDTKYSCQGHYLRERNLHDVGHPPYLVYRAGKPELEEALSKTFPSKVREGKWIYAQANIPSSEVKRTRDKLWKETLENVKKLPSKTKTLPINITNKQFLYGDIDKDKISNIKDCRPLDKTKHIEHIDRKERRGSDIVEEGPVYYDTETNKFFQVRGIDPTTGKVRISSPCGFVSDAVTTRLEGETTPGEVAKYERVTAENLEKYAEPDETTFAWRTKKLEDWERKTIPTKPLKDSSRKPPYPEGAMMGEDPDEQNLRLAYRKEKIDTKLDEINAKLAELGAPPFDYRREDLYGDKFRYRRKK